MVINEQYYADTQEAYVPQECEAFGFNEYGGLDADGNYHCGHYLDSGEIK